MASLPCVLTAGRKTQCKDSVGGIKAVYFINFGVEPTFDAGTEEITDLQVDGAGITAYKYELEGAGNDFVETVQSNPDNGTTFWEQVVNVTLKKLLATTRKQLKLLAYGRPHIVIHDNNGNAIMVGLYNGCNVTGGTAVTGVALGDLSGHTLSLTGREKDPAFFISDSTLEDPFAGLTTAPTIVDE